MTVSEFLSETIGISHRWLLKTFRRPAFVFFALFQPIIWFLLFTQSFRAIADIPNFEQVTGTDNYLTFFSGAVVIQTVLTSSMQSGMGFVTDIETGYLDKMQVAPISRASILMGKLLADGVRIVIQTCVILVLAVALGVRFGSGPLGILVLLMLALAFGIAWAGISVFIALTTKDSEATLMIGVITTFPLLFLSTAVMPKELLPDVVQRIAVVNPISYIADALHALIITGLDWGLVARALVVILLVGFVSLGATTLLFRRAVTR